MQASVRMQLGGYPVQDQRCRMTCVCVCVCVCVCHLRRRNLWMNNADLEPKAMRDVSKSTPNTHTHAHTHTHTHKYDKIITIL